MVSKSRAGVYNGGHRRRFRVIFRALAADDEGRFHQKKVYVNAGSWMEAIAKVTAPEGYKFVRVEDE